MANYNPMDTPIIKGHTLFLNMCPKTIEERENMVRVPYSNAIESLMYYDVYQARYLLCSRIGE